MTPTGTTLLRGGTIHGPHHRSATAMLVAGDRIRWIGPQEKAPTADTVVPLHGRLVTPLFVDAHAHCTQTGLALTGLDLTGCRSLSQALEALRRHATATGGGGDVILGGGWDETDWPERRPPTPGELDRASGGAAVYLARVDVHSAVASPALLAACPEARALPGYHPDAPLTRDAHHAVRESALRSITPDQRAAAQRACRAHAASLGIGCLHEMAGPQISGGATDLAALLELAAAEPGPQIIGYWGQLHDLATVRRLGLAGAGGDLFCDGSLGSHTAALRRPYADEPASSGWLRYQAQELAEHIVACTRAGVQAGFHAIGDAATHEVLQAFTLAERRTGLAALRAARHRIEHLEMPPAATRLARLGVVASVQPAFDATWGGAEGMYAQRLGPRRAAGLNPLARLHRAGVPLAFGSDAPVTPLDPWGGVRAALWHRTPTARLPMRAAFAAATTGGWYAARRDGAGQLRPGAAASYAIWTVDAPLRHGLPELHPDQASPRCDQTVINGVTVTGGSH